MKKRKLTDEQLVILDMWYQFSYSTRRNVNWGDNKKQRRWSGGVSSLEGAEAYLKMKEIINSWGNKRPEIIW